MFAWKSTAALLVIGVCALTADSARAEDARVTIVTILASNSHSEVNPKLAQVATEVKKHDSSLTGFKIHSVERKDVNLGTKESFQLLKDVSADVTVLAKNEEKKRIQLSVKPPSMGEITYSICYDKFMPIVTRQLAGNDRVIIAIMAELPKPAAAPVVPGK